MIFEHHKKRKGPSAASLSMLLAFFVVISFQASVVLAQDEDAAEERREEAPQQQEAEKPAEQPAEQPEPAAEERREEPAENRDAGNESEGNQGNQRDGRPGGNQGQRNRGSNRGNAGGNANQNNNAAASREPTKYTISSSAENLKLIMHPQGDPKRTNLELTQGNDFVTEIMLINEAERPVEKIKLVIDYTTAFISPRVVNDGAIADRIDGAPKATVDRKLGQIIYEAKLKEPITFTNQQLLYLGWETLEPVIDSQIRFGRNRETGFSELISEGLPALGEPQEQGDGTVNMTVTIIPSDPAEALMMQEEPQLYRGTNERVGGIELALIPPDDIPRVGDIFPIQIYLDNSAYSKMDGVSAIIMYDSQVFDILDEDYDNWITLGHNIHDGAARDLFTFNYHMANAVYPTRGIIEYRVGTSLPDELVGISGNIATIYAVAKKPAKRTTFEFAFASREGLRTTEIKYLGEDVLGDVDIRNDGITNLEMTVLPELQTSKSSTSSEVY